MNVSANGVGAVETETVRVRVDVYVDVYVCVILTSRVTVTGTGTGTVVLDGFVLRAHGSGFQGARGRGRVHNPTGGVEFRT